MCETCRWTCPIVVPAGWRSNGSVSGSSSSAEQPVEVERIGDQAGCDLSLPDLARAVVIDLDAVLVGVAEVDGLADEVVGGTREPHALTHGMREPARQAGPIGQQQREVEQARAPGRRLCAGLLDELQQTRLAGAERGATVALGQDVEADRPPVVVERAPEVGDGEVHGAHVRLRGDSNT